MTGMLASVNSLKETQVILNTAIEIIDLKQPEQGALGALPIELVQEIVQFVNQQKTISATVGDLPMQPGIVCNAVNAMAKTGVDYIKIGFFPEGDWQATITQLAKITQQGHKLIAVLFADTQPDLQIIESLEIAGFSGVMLDTMDKSKGSLLQTMPIQTIEKFVNLSKQSKLLCGLAGSLKEQDIVELLNLKPDYLGFRGALCTAHKRTAQLDKEAVNTIIKHFH